MLLSKNVLLFRAALFFKGLKAAFSIRLSSHDVKAMVFCLVLFTILLGAKKANSVSIAHASQPISSNRLAVVQHAPLSNINEPKP